MDSTISPGRRQTPVTRAFARLPALALGLGLALSACSSPGTGPTAATLRSPVSLEAALAAMLRPAGPDSAEAFLRSLPATGNVDAVTLANRHDPRWTDTVTTLGFRGLAITIYNVASTGTRFPIAIRVTSPAYRSADGLQVGLDRQQLAAILGPPSHRQGDILIYRVIAPGRAPYQIEAQLEGGRVVSLRWSADLD